MSEELEKEKIPQYVFHDMWKALPGSAYSDQSQCEEKEEGPNSHFLRRPMLGHNPPGRTSNIGIAQLSLRLQ
jgi:hypothetical protein